MKKFTQTLLVVFMTVALFGTANGQTVTNQYYNVTSGNGYGLRFWSSDNYKIHMGNSSYYKYGPVQDYSIKMTMNNDADRGWTWGVLNTAPIAALSTQGTFQLANDLKVMGNTGIGTTSPAAKLHINAGSGQDGLRVQLSGSTRMWLNNNGGLSVGNYTTPPSRGLYVYGNVGIGTTSPSAPLHVNGAIKASTLNLDYQASGDWSYMMFLKVNRDKTKVIGLRDKDNNECFILWGNGVMDARQIFAEGFQVRPDAMGIYWYDHVFNDDYNLMKLNDVENYIKTNKHLPDIPSQKEVNESGFDLAEMDGLLLKKIEELTLYIIEQQKEIDELKNQISK
jgi:hypothetical protein